MDFNLKCVECTTEFVAQSSRAKFCSYRCRADSYDRSHPNWRFKYHIRTRYGLSTEQYNNLISVCDGKCQICKREFTDDARGNERLSIDHDHVTGEVRGILCHQCNAGLGWFKDRPDLLRAAADYLEKKEMSEIRITDAHVAETLGGVYMTPRDFDAHAFAIANTTKRMEKMWGEGRPHMLCDFEGKVPRYAISVWMVGPYDGPTYDGTHLFVTWFADEIPEDFLRSAMARIDQRGGWSKNAVGFGL